MQEIPGTVSIHTLGAGSLTLPERLSVTPLENQEARKTAPSLSFLIQHHYPTTGETTRIVFDLGIRCEPNLYNKEIRAHVTTRQPFDGSLHVAESISRGSLKPSDIDYVIFSHLHRDHVGMSADFPTSQFIVGNGSRKP
ncbi:hypothetical protein BBP40_007495 [Aspergillus hancockii]|nr:hypothetical protein BBP40_007495 [Aspergillus hancockii]